MKTRTLTRLASLGGLALLASLVAPAAASAAPPLTPMTPDAPTTYQTGCLTVLAQPLEPDWDVANYTGTYSGSTLTVTAAPTNGRPLAPGAQTIWTFPADGPCEEVTPAVPAADMFAFVEDSTPVSVEVGGVIYTAERFDGSAYVSADAAPGYFFPPDSYAYWVVPIEDQPRGGDPVERVATGAAAVAADDDGGGGTMPAPQTPTLDIFPIWEPNGSSQATWEGYNYSARIVDGTVNIEVIGWFPEGSVSTWTLDLPDDFDLFSVTPREPVVYAGRCGGFYPVLAEPGALGYYEYTDNGDGTFTLAFPLPESGGYHFADGAVTSWTYRETASSCVEATPVAPSLDVSDQCGVEATVTPAVTEGITYTSTREGQVVTTTATPDYGYLLPSDPDTNEPLPVVTTWETTIPEVVECEEPTEEPTETPTSTPTPSETPTSTPEPTPTPSETPESTPSPTPTEAPTQVPTESPVQSTVQAQPTHQGDLVQTGADAFAATAIAGTLAAAGVGLVLASRRRRTTTR